MDLYSTLSPSRLRGSTRFFLFLGPEDATAITSAAVPAGVALHKSAWRATAIDARCSHRGGPLESGDIEELDGKDSHLQLSVARTCDTLCAQLRNISCQGEDVASFDTGEQGSICVKCPWHGRSFCLETGREAAPLLPPANQSLWRVTTDHLYWCIRRLQ